jgi:hypothetical protein
MQCDEFLIDRFADGIGHGMVLKDPIGYKIEERGPYHCLQGRENLGGYHCGNGIRSIMKTVDVVEHKCQYDDDDQ